LDRPAERRPRRMREGRGLRRRVRGRGIADPDPSRRTGILLDPPGYPNGLPTARWTAPDAVEKGAALVRCARRGRAAEEDRGSRRGPHGEYKAPSPSGPCARRNVPQRCRILLVGLATKKRASEGCGRGREILPSSP
jgi:hypothetical protein